MLTNIEQYDNEHRMASWTPKIIHSRKIDRRNSVVTHTIPVLISAANVEENVEKKDDFRHRTSSCGARFNGRPSTTLQSPKPSVVKDASCSRYN